jgi:DNA-binding protein HU-beta
MNRDTLIRDIAAKTGVTQVTVRSILDAFQDITAESLRIGEKVSLHGFGVFEIKSRNPRIGRNPNTGEAVDIPARVLPSFTPSEMLKARISGQPSEKKPATKSPRISPAK